MKWTRTIDRRAGPGNLLDGRWEIRGQGRYYVVIDRQTQYRYPAGYQTFYASMKEARRIAEDLARKEDHGLA